MVLPLFLERYFMIYGNINTPWSVEPVPPAVRRALEYISATDLEALNFGVYHPAETFSVQVIDLTTKDKADTKAEVHRRKLDIHYSITGEETVYCRVAPTEHVVTDDQFDERDIGFYDDMDRELEIPLNPGDFVVFFPDEVHRPGCKKGETATIKKIVVKIDGDLIE